MIDVRTALTMVEKKYPTKRMYGNPGEWNGKFTFRFVEKTATDDEARWDARVVAVDKVSGEISDFNAFSNYDFIANETSIENY